MIKKIALFSLITISTLAIAQAPKPPEEVPSTMVQFLDEIEALQPLMVSQKKFKAPENQFNIQTHLNKLAEISTQLKHEPRLSTPFFQVMTDILPQHLAELKDSFKEGHKDYARTMLNATLDGCSSCHNQVKSKNYNLWKFTSGTIKGTTFEKAEYLFTVRQYDEALPLYKKVIQDFKPTSIEPISQDVQDALFKEQSILIRSKRNLKEAENEVQRHIGNPNLPEPVKRLLKSELASIRQMQKISPPDPATSKSKDMEYFAATTLSRSAEMGWTGNRNAVPQMFVSGLLYDFVQNHSAQEIGPGIYYWLAKCERKTSTNYFFPIAEFYLKECIDRYPLSNEAKLCFNDLESLDYERHMAKK